MTTRRSSLVERLGAVITPPRGCGCVGETRSLRAEPKCSAPVVGSYASADRRVAPAPQHRHETATLPSVPACPRALAPPDRQAVRHRAPEDVRVPQPDHADAPT